ncbi:Tricalbin-2 [Hamiltosporidium tvaerminnensis]|nr:Tricalbin-2 [Hamiltosporidium tvaerminnensis]
MNSPHIDFDLKPLKAVDLMDIPLLSNWINLTIKNTLETLLVNPNSIKIDMKQLQIEKSYFIGIIKIRIHRFIGINSEGGVGIIGGKNSKFDKNSTSNKYDKNSISNKFDKNSIINKFDKNSNNNNTNNNNTNNKITNNNNNTNIIYDFSPLKIEPDKLSVNIGVDNKLLFTTNQKKYSRIENILNFNEYFYFLIQNTDDNLNFEIRIGFNKIGSGNLNVKKVIEMGRGVVSVKVKHKGILVGIVDTMVEFYRIGGGSGGGGGGSGGGGSGGGSGEGNKSRDGNNKSRDSNKSRDNSNKDNNNTDNNNNINKTDSAIVTLKVLHVEDMLGLNTSRRKIYSSFCSFIISDRKCCKSGDKKKGFFNPFSLVTGTASVLGNTLINAGNALGMGIGGEEVDLSVLSRATPYTFYSFETKHSVETNSPAFNQEFDFYARNLKNDFLFMRINELGTENVIGKVEIPLNEITDNEECWYKLKESESGRIKLQFKVKPIENTTIKYFNNNFDTFRDYKYFIKIEILNFSNLFLNGCYSLIVKNNFNIFYFNSFFIGKYKIEKNIFIPICDFREFKVFLYKEIDNSEEFIGEGTIELRGGGGSGDGTDNINTNINNNTTNTTNTTNNTTNITDVSIEKSDVKITDLNISWIISPLYNYKGHSENPSKFKVIQVKFKEFYNIGCDFYCEFMSKNYILDRSVVSKNNILNGVYTLRVGSEEIRAIFRSADLGINKILGECLIPKRVMNERVYLDEERFWVDCEIRVNVGELDVLEMKCGWIKICIKKINLKKLIDPLFSVSKNENKIFKSKVLERNLNIICNEEIVMWIDGWSDSVKIEVFEYKRIETNRVVGSCEIEMNFLSKQKRVLECELIGLDGCTEEGTVVMSIEGSESKF